MATLMPSFVAELSRELNAAFTKYETSRTMLIPSMSRQFLEILIGESLVVRSGEWKSKKSIDCDDAQQIRRTIPEVINRVEEILENAKTDSINGSEQLLAIAILEYINKKWCGVFPFCR